jgi:excisionase family DNA binding protein
MSDFVTTKEAAEILGVTPGRVRAMIGAGRLPAQTVGTGQRSVHLIARADLKLVKNRKPGRPKGKPPEPRQKKS